MTATQANPKQNNKTVSPINVIYGKDRRRAIDKLQEIIDQALGQADPQLALNIYDGNEAELADVLDNVRTMPFLSPVRVVVVKDADPFITQYRQQLEQYLENPCSTGVLIMLANSFPANTKLAKSAKENGAVFAFDPVKPQDLPDYLTGYAAKQHQLKLDRQSVALLIELAGDDSGALMNEIDKIAAFLGPTTTEKTAITMAQVEKLVGNNRQHDVFNVINAMTKADVKTALNHLEKMLTQDKTAEFGAVGAFAWHLRRLYKGRILLEQGASEQTIISQLRIWPHAGQGPFIRQVRQLKIPQIAMALRELMKIDLAGKTGTQTIKTGLEKFIITFCRSQNESN